MNEFPWIWELHRLTNNSARAPLDPSEWPDEWKIVEFKEYARYPHIDLPTPDPHITMTFSDVFLNRRSYVGTQDKFPSLQQLSTFLYWSAGIRRTPANIHNVYRFYPSAGGRYPLEIYCGVNGNNILSQGVYHYNVKLHTLEKLIFVEDVKTIYQLFENTPFFESPYIFIITGVFQRTMIKYKERGYRFSLLEAGALIENFYLTATAIGLAPSASGRAVDPELDEILNLGPGEESVIALFALGKA